MKYPQFEYLFSIVFLKKAYYSRIIKDYPFQRNLLTQAHY